MISDVELHNKRAHTGTRLLVLLFTTCLLMLCAVSPCRAESTDELQVNWLGDSVFTGATGALWITFEALKSDIAPRTCNWCHSNALDDPITDAFAWSTPKYAAKTADITAYGVIPVFVTSSLLLSSGLNGRIENSGTDLMLIVETLAISSLFNQITKFSVGRMRPFVERGHLDYYSDRSDDNLSFYSGHTSMSFALVVAAGTIAHIRNYDVEPYIWGIGIPLATFVGYTRIAAEKHYFSDVLVGAVVGSAIGFLVPWLHRNTDNNIVVSVYTTSTEQGSDADRYFLSVSGQF